MAGPGQATQPAINVPMGPLVTPAMPVGQEAVDSMVNAFRQGQITSEDLVTRFGMQGRAQTQAGTSAAELAQLQAEAQKPLVEPTAQLQAATLGAGQAAATWGQSSLDTFRNTLGWFGDDPNQYLLPNGKPDYQKMAKVGAQRVAQLSQVDAWANMLKPAEKREVTLSTGEKKLQYINAMGQDVTPPSGGVDGSPDYWHYIDQLKSYLPTAHPLTKLYPMKYVSGLIPWHLKDQPITASGPGAYSATPEPVQGPPTAPGISALGPYATPSAKFGVKIPASVSAESPQVQSMRQKLMATMDPAQVAQMSTDDVIANSPVKDLVTAAAGAAPVAPAVTPLAPAATPVIEPGLAPYNKGITIFETPRTVWTEALVREEEKKIRTEFVKEPPVQQWLSSVAFQKTFEKSADQVRGLSNDEQKKRNLNVVDLGLAESLIKLYDPQGVIREFKWDKFEKNQPTLDLLNAATTIYVARKGSFTPETRRELIKMGDEIIKGREEAAAPFIAKTKEQAASVPGAKLGNILTTEDARVAAEQALKRTGKSEASTVASVNAAPGPGWSLRESDRYGKIWVNGSQFKLAH